MVDISFLINRLASLIEKRVMEEYDLFANSKTEAIILSSSLKEIQKVLEEAEKRRMTDPRVRGWIERLQDVTYDIDDVLDEWTQIERHDNVVAAAADDDDEDKKAEKVCLSIKNPCFNVKRLYKRRSIAMDMRDLNARVDLLDKETIKYSLLPVISDSQESQLNITTPFAELFEIIDQTVQTKGLVLKLLSSSEEQADDSNIVLFPGQVKDIHIYSLVGLAGVGKTTMARLVFHDADVQANFSLRLWTCVSKCVDGVGMCKAILEALNIWLPHNTPDFQNLLHHITSSVSGKKFFLVLDDVRIEDEAMWNELKACFRYGAPGSRILVSTRNKKVATAMGHSSRIVSVDPLSDDNCQLLLECFAFRGRKKEDFPKLESITHSLGGKCKCIPLGGKFKDIPHWCKCKDLAAGSKCHMPLGDKCEGMPSGGKCKGIPLAAKTLGIYLNSTVSEDLWSEVLTKELWEYDEMSKTIFAPLASSYKDLPLVLKHCLSYTATFLPNCEIEVNELIRLWSVHGYLDFGGTKGDVDIRGQEYVEKLTEHSFFQNCITDQISNRFSRVHMHDILHDFAQYLLMNESKAKQLRHINCEELTTYQHNDLKYARLMILKCCFKLPVKIRSMIHLRYLDLKGTTIVQLPASICYLFNLQTLDLQKCEYLVRLPEKIHKLRINLKFLLLEGTKSLTSLPKGIKKLTSIQTLDQFVVKADGRTLRYLKRLNNLQGSLCVRILKTMSEKEVAKAVKAKLKKKVNLSDLTFFFWADGTKELMEALEPPPNLLSLCIDGYGASELPSWFTKSLHSVKKLIIKSCSGLLHLPALGVLRSLEELTIESMDSLKFVGSGFMGTANDEEADQIQFPKLKILTFRSCGVLEEWEYINNPDKPTLSIMPLLESLNIQSCPRLERLPTRFHNSRQLHVSDSPRLSGIC